MVIKTVQTLVFEYPEDYQAEVEWNKKRGGDWVHQSTDTICSVYTLTNNYLIPTKAKHSFVDNPYFEDEPQTSGVFKKQVCPIIERANEKKDKPIDCFSCKHDVTGDIECTICNDNYSSYEPKDKPQTEQCDTCKHKGKYAYCRLCGRRNEDNYEPQTDCAWNHG